MTCVAGLIFVVWVLALTLTLYGTILTLRGLKAGPPHLDAPFALYPVSILKPLKGIDNGIRENIETFFSLDYPHFELLFSISDASDPARTLVESMMAQYPAVKARLVIGGVEAGPNPKVNNLIRSYDLARHDLVLISDSNVRVQPAYLKQLVGHLENGVGIITAVVAGREADTLGGRLEATYLNTFYARWMYIAANLGNPCVVGKSMLFSRKTAARFGGIRALAGYLAEDYMAGVAMKAIGQRVVIQSHPVHQHIGAYEVSDFWSRHLRWGRIRKAQAPLAFFIEPFFGALVSGVLGAIACSTLWHIPPSQFALFHFGVWSLCDLALMRALDGSLRSWMPSAWLVRELLAVPLWAHTAVGNTVLWRGKRLAIQRGGLLKTH